MNFNNEDFIYDQFVTLEDAQKKAPIYNPRYCE